MYFIRHWLMLALLLIPASILSKPLFAEIDYAEITGGAKFLPVEQAYQLSVSHENQATRLSWLIEDGYYLYKHQFALFTPQLERLVIDPVYFSQGEKIYDEFYERDLEVFRHLLEMEITLPFNSSTQVEQNFIVESQACADAGLCYPPRRQYVEFIGSSVTVTDVAHGYKGENLTGSNQSTQNQQVNITNKQTIKLGLVLFFALIGGMILNLMPCVFPVLSIKVLSLSTHHQSTSQRVSHGVTYCAGVIISFVGISGLMLILRSVGQSVGWGFQLQSPVVVMFLIYLFVLMGLSFSGVFTMGSRFMNFGQQSTEGVSLRSSFLSGVLATIVASPCTAPFMGTALGFALTQSVIISLLVFATLGLGMGLPVLLLSAWPRLTKLLPHPGQWMEVLKQLLAFPLYLTAVWLLWVLGRQVDVDLVALVIMGMVMLIFAVWVAHQKMKKSVRSFIAIISVIVAILLPIRYYQQAQEPRQQDWQSYSPDRLESLLADRRPVFINVTADWCITCLANEKAVLGSDDIKRVMLEQSIVYLKADWTRYDPAITQLLNAHQRSGVPLYLYYPAGKRTPEILPQILRKASILQTFSGN